MHIRLIAVGDRQPAWVDAAFSEYAGRLPRHWQFRLDTVATASRRKGRKAGESKVAEAEKILSKIDTSDFVVLLDESGREFKSREVADKLLEWQTIGRDVIFIIGGPDGVAQNCFDRANLQWSLSKLTLPHSLARILFAEQIYRAWSLTTGHPYHRE